MIVWAMIFLGGFLVASLLTLMLIPVVHNRAVRLARRRLEEFLPESLVELQIDKDHLRTGFAMSMHRLERRVEHLTFKATTQLCEIARKTEANDQLKTELARRIDVADELAHKVESLTDKIAEVERERQRNGMQVVSIELALSAKEMEFARSAADQRLVVDSQRAEIAAVNAQIEQYQSAINQLRQHGAYTAHRPFDEPMETLAIIKELEEEYQAARYWQTSRQIDDEITTHGFDDAGHVFTQSGSIVPDQTWP